MTLFPPYMYVVAALLVTNALSLALWRSAEHEVAMIELASQVAEQDAKRVIAEQKQITEDTANAWKAALDVTRDSWAKRLRNANVQPMPGISGPAGGVDGLPANALALAAQCAETTEQLIALQGWVAKQRSAK